MTENKVDAKIEMPGGTTITISGTKQDVEGLLKVIPLDATRRSKKKQRKGAIEGGAKRQATGYKIQPIIKDLVTHGFLKNGKKVGEVVAKLDQKGYPMKGRKVGGVATALTYLCRNPEINLERKEVKAEEREAGEKWVFYSK